MASNESVRGHHSKLRLYKPAPAYVSQHPCYVELAGNAESEMHIDNETDKGNLVDGNVYLSSSSSPETDLSSPDVPSVSDPSCKTDNVFSNESDSQKSFVGFNNPAPSNPSGSEKSYSAQLGTGCPCRGCQFEETLEAEAVNRAKVEDQLFSPRYLPRVTAFGKSDIVPRIANFKEM